MATEAYNTCDAGRTSRVLSDGQRTPSGCSPESLAADDLEEVLRPGTWLAWGSVVLPGAASMEPEGDAAEQSRSGTTQAGGVSCAG
jgi:hypothetical protein